VSPGKRTLVLGATSAVAGAVARECARRGERLFLIGRDAAKLAKVVESLGAAVVGSATGDFEDAASNARLAERAITELGGLDSVFVVHGLLPDQRETEVDFAAAAKTLAVNFTSVVSFLVPLANHLSAQRSGAIVVVGSVAGDRGRPRNYTYGAAKGGLAIYLQGLRSRLYRDGVRVVTIKLGPVDTPMTATHKKNLLFAEVEAVGAAIVGARSAGPTEAYVPGFWRPIMWVVRSLPEPVFQRLAALSGR
jgi:decaprenylphospho-beta-D-erythro-pentofuranosid-2-ulose 2-reductase